MFALYSYLTSIFPLPSQCKISVLPFPSPISVLKIILICLSVLVSYKQFSVQFSHSVVSDSLRPYGLQHARPPCPSPTPSLLKLMSIQPSHAMLNRGPADGVGSCPLPSTQRQPTVVTSQEEVLPRVGGGWGALGPPYRAGVARSGQAAECAWPVS